MTFLEIVQLLITTAREEPNINTVVREFTDLNREDIEYSAVVIQDRDGYRDYINNQDYITYSFYIGYVDVLSEEKDNSGSSYTGRECDTYDNRDHIVSTGVTVINDMINVINNSYYPQLELRVSDRINTFHQRFTAECAGVYMVVNANVPISDCVDSDVKLFDTLQAVVTSNGDYHWAPFGGDLAFNQVDITVDVSGDKPEEGLVETISSNGSYHFDPSPGRVFSSADITVAVSGGGQKPEESLIETISSNGSYHYDPSPGSVFSGADISVDVHPSVSLSETYTSNGTYSISGEYNGGEVTVAVPQKTEVICDKIINENGSFHYTPVSGEVFNDVHITADVHPSVSLSETYTSNGTYNISGEYSGGTVTVAVSGGEQKPEESLVETISSNGSYHYDPSAGSVFSGADITVSVPSKPEVGIRDTITSNGSYYVSAPYGEVLSYVDLTVSVPERKPEESLVETISSNGSYHYDPSAGSVFSGADISVDVHPSQTLIETIAVNGTRNFTGEWKDAEITVSVPAPVPVTSSLSASISSNGHYSYTAPAGEYYDSVAVDVSVPSAVLGTYSSSIDINTYSNNVVDISLHPSDFGVDGFSDVSLELNIWEGDLSVSISENGRYFYDSPSPSLAGAFIYAAAISVDVHPSVSLVQSITSNGVTTLSGEWKDAEITVSVPAPVTSSLSVNISSNGSYSYTAPAGEYYDSVAVDVSVPGGTVLTITQVDYNNLSVKDPNTIYLIYG